MMVWRITKVKKPDRITAPIIMTMLVNKSFFTTDISVISPFIYSSTVVKDLLIKRGVNSDKIRAIMVVIIPNANRYLYLKKYLFKYFKAFKN